MKKIFLIFTFVAVIDKIQGQAIIVNADGTHSTVIDNGATKTIVNPNGTHSTVIGNGTTKTIVNSGGTHSTVIDNGVTKTIVNPDGTHSTVIDNGATKTIVNPNDSGKVIMEEGDFEVVEDVTEPPPPHLVSKFATLRDWLLSICEKDRPQKPISKYKIGTF